MEKGTHARKKCVPFRMTWWRKLLGLKEPNQPQKKEEEPPMVEMDDTTFLANKYVDKSDPADIGGHVPESEDSPLDFDFDID